MSNLGASAVRDDVDGLGPHLGALPSDVLRRCLLSRLSALSIAMFARASGACWRATKDARLATSLDVRSCEFAAQGGHLALLRYLRQNGCPWDESTWRDATRGGHDACLSYLREHGCPRWEETRDDADSDSDSDS